MAHLVGALPLLEGFGADGEGARAHGQQHDERAQQQRHHRPEDAVHQDAGVMGTPPQDVVRPKDKAKQRQPKRARARVRGGASFTLSSGRSGPPETNKSLL